MMVDSKKTLLKKPWFRIADWRDVILSCFVPILSHKVREGGICPGAQLGREEQTLCRTTPQGMVPALLGTAAYSGSGDDHFGSTSCLVPISEERVGLDGLGPD